MPTPSSDPRLDQALARAAEMVAVCEPMYIAGFPHGNEAVTQVMPDALAGWAEAIRHLTTVEDAVDEDDYIPHLGSCYVGKCDICKAIASFIKDMLGGSHD